MSLIAEDSVISWEDDAANRREQAVLLCVVQAANFLVPQDQLPLADSAQSPVDNALLHLEHVFKVRSAE